jgi:hypothetical protein
VAARLTTDQRSARISLPGTYFRNSAAAKLRLVADVTRRRRLT